MPNRILSERILDEPRLEEAEAKCRGAIELYYKLISAVDDYDRFTAVPLAIRGRCYSHRPGLRDSQISLRLEALAAARLLTIHAYSEGKYLQLNQDGPLNRRSDVKQPKYGPRIEIAPTQGELPMLVGMADSRPGPKTQTPHARKQPPSQPSRFEPFGYESECVSEDESPAATRQRSAGEESSGQAAAPSTAEPRTKKEERSASFSRTESAADHPLWGDLFRLLGKSEMTQNGALWLRRFETDRLALLKAVMAWKDLAPEERAGGNAAAYITRVWEVMRKAG